MKKLLYIHGWGFNNYTFNGPKESWFDRPVFVNELSKSFEVIPVRLPGFFGESDPERPWLLQDFVNYLDKVINKEKPDYILGYSFGGAVSLSWKKLNIESSAKLILVSPAIVRKYKKVKFKFIQLLFKKLLSEKLIHSLSNFYLKYVIRNPHYSNASKVMMETYRNIVKIDLTNDLRNLDEPMTIIYGAKDTATPPSLALDAIKSSKVKHNLYIIPEGGHDIGRTHTKELVSFINKLS